MLKTYLVSYDLMNPGKHYPRVYEYFSTFGDKAKPLYTVYLLSTALSAIQIRDGLKAVVDTNDKILVVEISNQEWAAYNLGSSAEWLKRH